MESYGAKESVKLIDPIAATDGARKQAETSHASMFGTAAYRVRDPETNEFSNLQFHATWNNTVLAVMGEEAAKLFARFVTQATRTDG